MNTTELVVRSWNGAPISRRTTDGYVNATAMCKANGKRVNDYFRTERAIQYLEALSGSTGIPVDQLFTTIETGPNEGRGTWAHPQLGIDLARWINAPFAVWMDAWVLEGLDSKQPPVGQKLTPQDPLFGLLEGQQPSQELIDEIYKLKMSVTILQALGKTQEQALYIALHSAAQSNPMLSALIESAGGSFALGQEIPEVTLGAAQVAELLPNDWDENFCRMVCEAIGKQYLGWKGRQRGYLVNLLAEQLGWLEKTYGPKSKKPTWQLTTEGQRHGIMKLALIPNSSRTSEKMNVHYFKSAVELIITKGNQICRDHINSCIEF